MEITDTLYPQTKSQYAFSNGMKDGVLSVRLGKTGRLVIWDIRTSKIIFEWNLHFLPGLAKDNIQVGVAARGTECFVWRRTQIGCRDTSLVVPRRRVLEQRKQWSL